MTPLPSASPASMMLREMLERWIVAVIVLGGASACGGDGDGDGGETAPASTGDAPDTGGGTSGDDVTTTTPTSGEATSTGETGDLASSSSSTGEATTDVEPGGSSTGDPGDGSGVHCATPGSGVPVAASPAGPKLSETMTLAGSGAVGDLDVGLELTSGMDADNVQIRLTHGGTMVDLLINKCGDNEGLDVTLDDEAGPLTCCEGILCSGEPLTGSFQPDQPLAAFDGMAIAGDWTLEILANVSEDPNAANQAVLDAWCLTLAL